MSLRNRIDNTYGSVEARLERWRLDRRFDLLSEWWIYGVEQPLLTGTRSDEPSPWGVLARIFEREELGRDDVLLDLGCGRGHVLLEAAATYPLARVVGVELDAGLCKLAERTLEDNRLRLRSEAFEIVNADGSTYSFPDDVTILYLCNPFGGEAFDRMLENLFASLDRRPRRLRLVYFLPGEADRLEATGRARLIRRGRRGLRRWSEADYLRLYEVLPESRSAVASEHQRAE